MMTQGWPRDKPIHCGVQEGCNSTSEWEGTSRGKNCNEWDAALAVDDWEEPCVCQHLARGSGPAPGATVRHSARNSSSVCCQVISRKWYTLKAWRSVTKVWDNALSLPHPIPLTGGRNVTLAVDSTVTWHFLNCLALKKKVLLSFEMSDTAP